MIVARYKIGFSPKYEPYQMEDEYTVYFDMQPIGGLPFQNIVFSSPDIKECMKKQKELNAKYKLKGGDKNGN